MTVLLLPRHRTICPKSQKVEDARVLLILERVVDITYMNEETEAGPAKDRDPVGPGMFPFACGSLPKTTPVALTSPVITHMPPLW